MWYEPKGIWKHLAIFLHNAYILDVKMLMVYASEYIQIYEICMCA